MKQIYLIANWKMNPTTSKEARQLWSTIGKNVSTKGRARVVLCPPYSYLSFFSSSKNIALGAQNCFWEQKGAYTGAVSPLMLKDLGCTYVIVGHSERREYFAEDNQVVNKKVRAALSAGLRPVLAIGEKTRQTFDKQGRHTRELDPVVEKQLVEGLAGVSRAKIEQVIVTYEPVWAISQGNP